MKPKAPTPSLWPNIKMLLIFLAPAVTIGAILGALPGYRLYKFVWDDERFCMSCHVHDYANVAWKESIHGNLTTCHDCHHQPLREYMREAIVMILKQPKFPKDLHHVPYVPRDLCQACHVSSANDHSTITGPMSSRDISKLPKVDKMRLHKLHMEKKTTGPKPRPITCVDCHGGESNRAHNFSASDDSCLKCHEKKHEMDIPNLVGCRRCHFQEFMVEEM